MMHIEDRLLLGLGAAALLIAPFLVGDYLTGVLVDAAVYTIIAVGLNLFMGYTGQISFGHNAFAAIGGYTSAILTTKLALPTLLTIPIAAILAAAMAVVIGYPTLRLRGHYLAMATLALGLITFEVALQWRSLTGGSFGIAAIPPLGVGHWELFSTLEFYYVYWAIALVVVWISYRIRYSRVGYALRSVAGNEDAARALGIDVARYKLLAFVVSAVLASLGGSLYAHHVTYISPEVFGLYMVILLFTMLFVGGIGTTFGPLLGAVTISLLPEMLRQFNEMRELLYGGLLLLILLFAPRGLYGLRDLLSQRRAQSPIAEGS
jgi:branched-chain amino acid transport system permease protein